MINYYGKFLPNLQPKLRPLGPTVEERYNTRWHWNKSRAEAFEAAKKVLQDDTLLARYDNNHQLVLACDAVIK